MNTGRFSVNNPVFVNILMVALVVLGALSFFRLPREMMSDISFSWAFITVPYPGVSAEEIEKNITVKIEDAGAGIARVKKIGSVSRAGVGFVEVQFEDNISQAEFRRLYQQLREEVDKVELPPGALKPMVMEVSTADMMPIITVNLSGAADDDTRNTVARDLREKLRRVADVSKVEIIGSQDREVMVEADRTKLEAYGISLDEVVNAIRFRNMNIPGGTLETEEQTYILQLAGEIKDPASFGKTIIRRRPGGSSLAVADVAAVNNGYARAKYDARYNGKKTVSLLISKKKEGNSIRVVDGVKQLIEAEKKMLPPGLSLTLFNDTTVLIRNVLRTLWSDALSGFILLVLILLLVMGVRNSLMTGLGIPVTFAITFLFMDWYGESLNANSLFALVLVLGMIVDNAIVVIENCYRHRQLGLSRTEAAVIGTHEMMLPVLTSTAAIVAAFLPLMLLPGIMGKFMRVIPFVASLALVASAAEALLFLPSHFASLSSTTVKALHEGFFARWQAAYKRFISRIYPRRYLAAGIALLVVIAAMGLAPFVKQDLYNGEDMTQFLIDIQMPIGTPRPVTDRVVRRFEERLMPLLGNKEVVSIGTTVGFCAQETEWVTQSNVGQITVELAQKKDGRKRSVVDIMDYAKKLCADIPGAENIVFRKLSNGPPVDKPVSFRLQGENMDEMADIAADLKKSLGAYPELYNIKDNYDKAEPELSIAINEERASDMGLTAGMIGMYVRSCFDGVKTTTYYDGDQGIDVVVRLSEKDRKSIDDVMQMKIPTPDGRLIPFSTVCVLKQGKGIAAIKRRDRAREITVTADADNKKNIRVVMAAVQKEYDAKFKDGHPGIALKMGGEFEEFNRVLADVLRLFWVGLFLIYLVLGGQFKSLIQPFIIMLTIPFAFVGCVLFLYISGTAFSMVVMFSIVALAGIAVNHVIVMISFVNSLRRKGMPVSEAVIEGCATRMRPVFLTSISTIVGLLGMALGIGGYSETWGPMASTIVFGMFFSTAGTLIVIPCIYGIVDDITVKLGRRMKLEGEG